MFEELINSYMLVGNNEFRKLLSLAHGKKRKLAHRSSVLCGPLMLLGEHIPSDMNRRGRFRGRGRTKGRGCGVVDDVHKDENQATVTPRSSIKAQRVEDHKGGVKLHSTQETKMKMIHRTQEMYMNNGRENAICTSHS